MKEIKIQALDKEEVIAIKATEDEGKYFVVLEVTKDKYEQIKKEIQKQEQKRKRE